MHQDVHLLLLTEAWKEGIDQLSLILEHLKQIQCKAEPSLPHKQRWQIYFTWDTNACPRDRNNLNMRWKKCFYSKRREIGREKAGVVKHSGFRNAQCPTCASAHRLCTSLHSLYANMASFIKMIQNCKVLVAHLFKLVSLFFMLLFFLTFIFWIQIRITIDFLFNSHVLLIWLLLFFFVFIPVFLGEEKTGMFELLTVLQFLLQSNRRQSDPSPLTSESLSAIISSSEPSSSEDSAKKKTIPQSGEQTWMCPNKTQTHVLLN